MITPEKISPLKMRADRLQNLYGSICLWRLRIPADSSLQTGVEFVYVRCEILCASSRGVRIWPSHASLDDTHAVYDVPLGEIFRAPLLSSNHPFYTLRARDQIQIFRLSPRDGERGMATCAVSARTAGVAGLATRHGLLAIVIPAPPLSGDLQLKRRHRPTTLCDILRRRAG